MIQWLYSHPYVMGLLIGFVLIVGALILKDFTKLLEDVWRKR